MLLLPVTTLLTLTCALALGRESVVPGSSIFVFSPKASSANAPSVRQFIHGEAVRMLTGSTASVHPFPPDTIDGFVLYNASKEQIEQLAARSAELGGTVQPNSIYDIVLPF